MRLTFVVDDAAMVRALHAYGVGIGRLVQVVSQDLANTVRGEAGAASSRLGAAWPVEGAGPTERHVVAPEWWAHFLAHGTQAHGPTGGDFLTFEVGGDAVFATFVAGIQADPFDERATMKTRARLDALMARAIGGTA